MNRYLLALFVVGSIIGSVLADCDPPASAPRACTEEHPEGQMRYFWPCCQLTQACPNDGSRKARFYKSVPYYNSECLLTGPGHTIIGRIEDCQCCGDAPGMPDPADMPCSGV